MTCYFRHMKSIFEKAGITISKENKQSIDMTIHKIVGVEYKNCSSTWREVKKHILEDEKNFLNELKREILQ